MDCCVSTGRVFFDRPCLPRRVKATKKLSLRFGRSRTTSAASSGTSSTASPVSSESINPRFILEKSFHAPAEQMSHFPSPNWSNLRSKLISFDFKGSNYSRQECGGSHHRSAFSPSFPSRSGEETIKFVQCFKT